MTTYIKWKSWDVNQFGITSKEHSIFYEKLFSRYLPEAKNVLEIGYGNESFLNWYQEKDLNVHGVEQDKDLDVEGGHIVFIGYAPVNQYFSVQVALFFGGSS